MNEPIDEARFPSLDNDERARYEWQLTVSGFGEAGQRRLKGSTVLVTRCGGVGGTAAYQLAAAGVGKLILAHAGDLRPSDLNRQLLMTTDWLGRPRVESAARRLRELNPHVEIISVAENVAPENVGSLVSQADLVVDAAPLFTERFLLNQEIVRQRKPMVDSAMYELDGQLTTFLPGQTACLSCLFPENPPHWRRQFPVFGAVAGTVGCLAAMEAIKVLAGFGEPLHNRLLTFDLHSANFHTVQIARRSDCPVCASIG